MEGSRRLDEARLLQIQDRLDSGAYHTREVAEKIAQRLHPEIA